MSALGSALRFVCSSLNSPGEASPQEILRQKQKRDLYQTRANYNRETQETWLGKVTLHIPSNDNTSIAKPKDNEIIDMLGK